MPSEHTIVLIALIAAGVLIASVLVVRRDAWVPVARSHKQLVRGAVIGAIVIVLVALAISHADDLEELLERVEGGDPWWLALAVALEAVSFGGYVVLTRELYRPVAPLLNWTASLELTLAGVVATRVFSAGGAGGIAFTAWVLHRAGIGARATARRLAAFMAILYSVYMGALLVGGLVVVTGVLPDVPAALGWVAVTVGGIVVALVLLMLKIPRDVERRVAAMAKESGRRGRIATRLATVPGVAGNAARLSISIIHHRPSILIWPLVWWAFDVAVLWATFHAFGEAPAIGTIVLCYFLGSLGNLLPLPGGVGGTEGGMLGAFAASGVDAGLALLAVVAYQVISTYLPALPGLIAYLDLRRRMKTWGPEPAEESVATT